MLYAGRTHPGRRGGQNEDAIGWDETHRLWFVADGMGGHASGDVASRIVRETLLSAADTALDAAVRKAHQAVAAAGAASVAHENMGSTVVAARLSDRQGEIVWVGDSRAYLWRSKTLQLVTRDHSFLEMLREQEDLSDEQLRGHPNKNLVTQTLGIGLPEPSSSTILLRPGDWLLLCSDGLNDELDDGKIAELLATNSSPEAAADALIAAALASGGKDNVSVIVVEYDGPDGVTFLESVRQYITRWNNKTQWKNKAWSKIRTRWKNQARWLPIAAGVLAAVLAAGLWLWLGGLDK